MNPFARTSPNKIASDQLYEAERQKLEHRAAAEHHAALADMYEQREGRLREYLKAKEPVRVD